MLPPFQPCLLAQFRSARGKREAPHRGSLETRSGGISGTYVGLQNLEVGRHRDALALLSRNENVEIFRRGHHIQFALQVLINPDCAQLDRFFAARLDPNDIGVLRRSQTRRVGEVLHFYVQLRVSVVLVLLDFYDSCRSRNTVGRRHVVLLTRRHWPHREQRNR
jgi:hypothetical protein